MHKVIDEMHFDISEPSDNAQIVYSSRQIVAQIGFDVSSQFLIATAVSELSTNIIRYAGKGTITLRIIQSGDRKGFVVLARDHGPGIENIEKAFKDHYSVT